MKKLNSSRNGQHEIANFLKADLVQIMHKKKLHKFNTIEFYSW